MVEFSNAEQRGRLDKDFKEESEVIGFGSEVDLGTGEEGEQLFLAEYFADALNAQVVVLTTIGHQSHCLQVSFQSVEQFTPLDSIDQVHSIFLLSNLVHSLFILSNLVYSLFLTYTPFNQLFITLKLTHVHRSLYFPHFFFHELNRVMIFLKVHQLFYFQQFCQNHLLVTTNWSFISISN